MGQVDASLLHVHFMGQFIYTQEARAQTGTQKSIDREERMRHSRPCSRIEFNTMSHLSQDLRSVLDSKNLFLFLYVTYGYLPCRKLTSAISIALTRLTIIMAWLSVFLAPPIDSDITVYPCDSYLPPPSPFFLSFLQHTCTEVLGKGYRHVSIQLSSCNEYSRTSLNGHSKRWTTSKMLHPH